MGWVRNPFVRLVAAALLLWAAFDALLVLLVALFPGHVGPSGQYRPSWVQDEVQVYWDYMYPTGYPNWTRLFAVLRYGATIAACVVGVWRLRPRGARRSEPATAPPAPRILD